MAGNIVNDLAPDVTIRYGLAAQGHIPTIGRLLAAGASWDEIGREIGWCPATAERHYGRYLASRLEPE